jgi:hypothetical protein
VKLLAIIVNYRIAELTVKAVEALLREIDGLPDSRVVVVENDSRDGSLATLSAAIADRGWSDRVHLIASPRNGGFGSGVNIGVKHGLALPTPPEYVYLLNPDAEPDRGAVAALVAFMDSHPRAGIAGSHIHAPDGTPSSSAFRFPSILGELDNGLHLGVVSRLLRPWVVAIDPSRETFEVDWVSGASFIVRRAVLQEVGLFDEAFFLYFEEVDLCLRARRQGWSIWHVGESTVGHIEGASTGMNRASEHDVSAAARRRPLPAYWFASRRRYFEKNHGALYRIATDAVFLTSYSLWRARRRLQRKPDRDPTGLWWDFFKHSVSATFQRGD